MSHYHTNVRINGGTPENTGTYETYEDARRAAAQAVQRDPGHLTEQDRGPRYFSATKVSRRAGKSIRRSAWACSARSCV